MKILRVAARRATHEGLDTVSDNIIRNAVSEAKSEIRQRNVDRLTSHQQVVYEIITDHGEIEPRELYAEYRERADNPKSDRMVRNYLKKMERYNLVRSEGHNRGRTYHSVS
jgi:Cdc6-like AAA superfamily ATPase